MRLWSIHPKYLDTKGLLAVWREALLAKKVLQGNTIGYKSHPQLIRFKNCHQPIAMIDNYLSEIFQESLCRKYKFDQSKFADNPLNEKIPVTTEQIQFEWTHLMSKLKTRKSDLYEKLKTVKKPKLNDIFLEIPGKIESWEIQ